MADIKNRKDYARAIAQEWIRHATESDRLAEECTTGTVAEQAFHAFMANAINDAAQRAAPDIRDEYHELTRAYA